MLSELERRVSMIEPRTALASLTKQIAHVSTAELESLSLARSTCFAVELQRAAQQLLRAVMRLPLRLRQIVAHVRDDRLDVGLRLGLRAILRALERHVTPAVPEPVALAELAFALELSLARLHPWLPPSLSTPDTDVEIAALGLVLAPDEQRRLHTRIASGWRRFHRLRVLGPEVLRPRESPMDLDEGRLLRLLADPRARAVSPPPAPQLPRCDTYTLEPDAAIPRFIIDETSSLEIQAEADLI
jgi:hypothetical protein